MKKVVLIVLLAPVVVYALAWLVAIVGVLYQERRLARSAAW